MSVVVFSLGKSYAGCKLEYLVREALDLEKVTITAVRRRDDYWHIGRELDRTELLFG